jgi:superoxide dismutase
MILHEPPGAPPPPRLSNDPRLFAARQAAGQSMGCRPHHDARRRAPVLVLDMYEHAYHMDYGAAAARYVDVFMEAIRKLHKNRTQQNADSNRTCHILFRMH